MIKDMMTSSAFADKIKLLKLLTFAVVCAHVMVCLWAWIARTTISTRG